MSTDPPILDYQSGPLDEAWKTLITYHQPLEAELAAAALRAEGIPAQLTGGHTATNLGIYGSGVARVELRVREVDYDSARAIIDDIEHKRQLRAQPGLRCPKCGNVPRLTSSRTRIFIWAAVFAGILIGSALKAQWICALSSVAILLVVFLPSLPRWKCRECGYVWHEKEPGESEED